MAIVRRVKPKGGTAPKKARTDEPAAEELSLPTERSAPSNRIQDYSQLWFGEKKIGKTDLSAQFPDTFHMMAEPGGKAQSIFQRPVPDWKTFLGYVRLLKKDKRFRTATVDTVDMLYNKCFDHMMRKLGIDHPSDEAYGKGWSAIRQEFARGIIDLLNTGKGVILISHATEKEIKTRGGNKYNKIMPTLAGQGRDIVEGIVDLWFYFGYDGDKRVITVTGNDHISSGHRLKHNFRYPDGTAIHEIPMGDSVEEAYANLMAAFNNKLTGTSHEEPKKSKAFKLKKK